MCRVVAANEAMISMRLDLNKRTLSINKGGNSWLEDIFKNLPHDATFFPAVWFTGKSLRTHQLLH